MVVYFVVMTDFRAVISHHLMLYLIFLDLQCAANTNDYMAVFDLYD